MLVMFGGFGAYFLYDWKVGYPQKNLVIAHYQAFNAAGRAWTVEEHRNDWEAFASEQKIPFGDDLSIYPEGTDFEAKWPAILANKAEMKKKSDEGLWKEYSGERGWPQQIDLEEDPKPAYKIKEQLIAAMVCLALTAIALFFLIRTKGRRMVADDKAYYDPSGSRIPYVQMTEIDKRKWETKGLATITYKDESGALKKAKVDGMIYGQFKEEDGAPAEALFQRILANFQGELIELVVEEDDEVEDGDARESEESEGDDGEKNSTEGEKTERD
ncbi:MAG: hypothetical protein ACSHYF_00670 [Verrucomicrobiaceae bacterium]